MQGVLRRRLSGEDGDAVEVLHRGDVRQGVAGEDSENSGCAVYVYQRA